MSKKSLASLAPGAASQEVAGRVRAEQLAPVVAHTPWMMFANATNALVLCVAFADSDRAWLVFGWTAVVVACSGMVGIRASRKAVVPHTVSMRGLEKAAANALLLGLAWSTIPLLLFRSASPGGQLVIACLSAGMIGGGAIALASIPRAAVALTAPIFVGSALALAQTGDRAHALIATLMVVYGSALLALVVGSAARAEQATIARLTAEATAMRDALTRLPNRTFFEDAFEKTFARLRRSGEPFALFYVDLDRFKEVNDTYGHVAGDDFLVEVASRLAAATRDVDVFARLGGDEFGLIASGTGDPKVVSDIAVRLLSALALPIRVGTKSIRASASIGIAIARSEADEARNLLRSADVALYRAKRSGRGTYRLFSARERGVAAQAA